MGSSSSKWKRWNWNPIFPGLMLLWWLRPVAAAGWDFSSYNWFRWLGLVWMTLWFTMALVNLFNRGKLVEWMYSDDDGEEEFKVPKSLAKFQLGAKYTSPLLDTIVANLPAGEDLESALDELEEVEISEPKEVAGVLSAYNQLCLTDDPRSKDLLQLVASPGSADAFGFFYRYGMPLLSERLKKVLQRGGEGDYDFDREEFQLMSNLSAYAYQPAFGDILSAAKDPVLSDSYMWGRIFSSANESDEDHLEMIRMFGNDLPIGFASVAFLDRCNELALHHDFDPHPFSSDAGVARLQEYFTDTDTEHFSWASSAATALPFISHPGRESLLDLAERHPESTVMVEAAWAGAKLGRQTSIERLAELCGDWKTGDRAMEFLRELDLGDKIPAAALEPSNLARCAMAEWLRHPNELAKLPDSLEVVDQREIYWPPLEKRTVVSLLKWISADDRGIGMTGGTTTWCFFSVDHRDQSVFENYARHCNWELQRQEMEGAPDSYDDLDRGMKLLNEKNPGTDWSPLPA